MQCKRLGRALELLRQIEVKERDESEEVESRLEKLKKASIEALLETFENLTASGKRLHLDFEEALSGAQTQLLSPHLLNKHTHTPLTLLALQYYASITQVPDIYLREVRSTVSLIRQIALQSAAFVDMTPEELLKNAFKRQALVEPKKYYGTPSKKLVLRENSKTYPSLLREQNKPVLFKIEQVEHSPAAKRPVSKSLYDALRNDCRICYRSLVAAVYTPLPEHEACKVCFECIDKCTKTYLKCPLCKVRYHISVRNYLAAHIPGLIKAMKRRRDSVCVQCKESSIAHECPSGNSLCVACCQLAVIWRKQTKCKQCEERFPASVLEGYMTQGCAGCGSEVKVTEVAECWRVGGGFNYYCAGCQDWEVDTWFTA